MSLAFVGLMAHCEFVLDRGPGPPGKRRCWESVYFIFIVLCAGSRYSSAGVWIKPRPMLTAAMSMCGYIRMLAYTPGRMIE